MPPRTSPRAPYFKTKNFHWHRSGPHFRDYHLLLDEQADQLYVMTDPIAERIRKVGGSALRSIGHIARTQRVLANDADYVEPLGMLAELREAHNVCDEHRDIATASLIEVWIDETASRSYRAFTSVKIALGRTPSSVCASERACFRRARRSTFARGLNPKRCQVAATSVAAAGM
jgi:DNA-binding ferritin-like protein